MTGLPVCCVIDSGAETHFDICPFAGAHGYCWVRVCPHHPTSGGGKRGIHNELQDFLFTSKYEIHISGSDKNDDLEEEQGQNSCWSCAHPHPHGWSVLSGLAVLNIQLGAMKHLILATSSQPSTVDWAQHVQEPLEGGDGKYINSIVLSNRND